MAEILFALALVALGFCARARWGLPGGCACALPPGPVDSGAFAREARRRGVL